MAIFTLALKMCSQCSTVLQTDVEGICKSPLFMKLVNRMPCQECQLHGTWLLYNRVHCVMMFHLVVVKDFVSSSQKT